ncbi:hypothetical protein FR773_22315 [Leclercia adecarboxylata]|uniref:hemagglutinin repeat-containing protein n=1 Tax=Leclercia adecarboxylata TaxID=83655 RepID=UPI0012A837D8|nr:hypothetical protein FR773_22315 [Leclercia adecarboxylata]QGP86196.1 hypothetical protein GLX29_22865 [Leclercia adecarboxylata]QIM45516.1 hypothetical protein G7098_20195 [Leclercia adecarboxylata]
MIARETLNIVSGHDAILAGAQASGKTVIAEISIQVAAIAHIWVEINSRVEARILT